jgi:hypothetical protein
LTPSGTPMDDELRGLVAEANRTIAAEREPARRPGPTERSTRTELRDLGVDLARSALGRAAIDLAQRLDADPTPTDRDVTGLVRELRQVLDALYRRHATGGGELDAFVAGISAAALRDQ